jgi:hypothetical protein
MNKATTPSGSKPFPWLLVAIGLLVLGAVAAVGWNWYQKRYPSWYEEVRLSDGRVITIHQKREYYENYGTVQSWVTIDLPELGGKQVWHSYLMPQRVDMVDGKVYVFGIPRGDRQLTYYRYPKYFMVGFIWQGSAFERIPFLSLPVAIREAENVFPCLPREANFTSNKLLLSEKDMTWCLRRNDSGKSSQNIDILEYKALADRWADIPRWEDKFRSE